MSSQTGFARTFRIAAEHSALAGHFPGDPVVPGVMLLEQVALGLRAWRQERLARVVEVKFPAPLLPAQTAQVELVAVTDSPRLRFAVTRAGVVVARGVIEGAP